MTFQSTKLILAPKVSLDRAHEGPKHRLKKDSLILICILLNFRQFETKTIPIYIKNKNIAHKSAKILTAIKYGTSC